MRDKILCLEDDATMQTLVEVSLPDFDVVCVGSISAAVSALKETSFSALLVDINLPDGDGLRFLGDISRQSETRNLPVLILSDRTEISNKVMAFSLGAEDFIAKPFDPIELRARVASKIKKRGDESEAKMVRRFGDLTIDLNRQMALISTAGSKERDLGLTSIELKILLFLTRRLEQVYSREQIIEEVWKDTHITDRTVDSHIAHLRQKLEGCDLIIETVKSMGYRASRRG